MKTIKSLRIVLLLYIMVFLVLLLNLMVILK